MIVLNQADIKTVDGSIHHHTNKNKIPEDKVPKIDHSKSVKKDDDSTRSSQDRMIKVKPLY